MARQPRSRAPCPSGTLTTFDETRDGHLQSPEFFDAERHPELRFVSTSVERDGSELVVAGDLTIKGITPSGPAPRRASQARPRIRWGNERIGLDLTGTIDRTAYGLRWNAPLPGGGLLLADDVRLEASFSAVKAA